MIPSYEGVHCKHHWRDILVKHKIKYNKKVNNLTKYIPRYLNKANKIRNDKKIQMTIKKNPNS